MMTSRPADQASAKPAEGMPPAESVTVIICTKDRLPSLLTGLEALAVQTRAPEELIVVDSSNPPLDTNKEFLAKFSDTCFPQTALLYLHSAPGLTLQKNLGIKHAACELVAFLDDDARVAETYLEALCRVFERSESFAGGMGALQGVARRPWLHRFQRFFMLTHSYGSGRFMPSGLPSLPHGKDSFQETETLSGGLMMVRKDVLDRYPFDETLTGYAYMEDVDFSRRISREYSLFYTPDARVHHDWSAPRGKRSRSRARMFIRHHGYLFFKNIYPYQPANIVFLAWSILGYFLMQLLRLDLYALIGAIAGVVDVMRVWWREG